MGIPYYIVHTFTEKPFNGNPAAVCLLDRFKDDSLLQKISAENNLPETAFLVRQRKGEYALRWFTPTKEIDLCGHATLAGAFVLFHQLNEVSEQIRFNTLSGPLYASKGNGRIIMDFPAWKPSRLASAKKYEQMLGIEIVEALQSRDIIFVLKNEQKVRAYQPDFDLLSRIKDSLGIIITARGNNCDFVSRFFAPNAGIPEDPVTGSAHSSLVPYWSEKLAKEKLYAKQVSKRGGELFCENKGDRVKISGSAVLYAKGELLIE